MDSADTLVEKIFSWVELQKQSAQKLKKLATELEELNKNINVTKVVGSSASVGGAAALAVAGVATLCTGGAAIPFLAGAGAVASGLGLATNVGSEVVSALISSNTMKEAKKISEEIESLGKEIQEHVETLSTETKARRKDVSPEDYVMERILRAIAKRNGLKLKDKDNLITLVSNMELKNVIKEDMNLNVLKESVQLSEFITGLVTEQITKVGLKNAKREVIKTSVKQAARTLGVKASSKAIGHIGKGAVGLLFAVPELFNDIENMSKCESEASITLRKQAEAIETTSKEMESEMEKIGELCQTMANMKWKKYRKRSCVIL